MKIEQKELAGGYSDTDIKSRVIVGYLSQVDVKDSGDDVIEKTAFDKTLSERKNQIMFLNQHNWAQPHGKFAELEVDSYGLKFVSNPLPDTTFSNDTLKLIEAKIIDKTSIGYFAVKAQRMGDVRYIKELKLYEGSTVTMPMNEGAIITGLKSMTIQDIQTKEKEILRAFKSGTFTDETFILLELALKELSAQAFELGKKEALLPFEKTQEPLIVDLSSIKNFKF
jgi:HK97 family phage prohead protease